MRLISKYTKLYQPEFDVILLNIHIAREYENADEDDFLRQYLIKKTSRFRYTQQ